MKPEGKKGKYLEDWLIKNPNKFNENSVILNETPVKKESEYFQNQKFSEIEENETFDRIDELSDIQLNGDFQFKDHFEFDNNFPIDEELEFDDDFEEEVNKLISFNEDFQFDKSKGKENLLTKIIGENEVKEKPEVQKYPPFLMSQWSLFIPYDNIEGKSQFIIKNKVDNNY